MASTGHRSWELGGQYRSHELVVGWPVQVTRVESWDVQYSLQKLAVRVSSTGHRSWVASTRHRNWEVWVASTGHRSWVASTGHRS